MFDIVGILSLLLKLALAAFLVLKVYLLCTTAQCTSKKRMDGKVVIITGSNSGIGKQTAKDLVRRGARVIMGCRDLVKAAEAATEILDEVPGGQIVMKKIDNCDFESVRAFAREILKEEEKIDVLINNAGTTGDSKFILTSDGFEQTYQTNYLAPFLLTELLVPILKKSAPSRVINVGSLAYMFVRTDTDTLARDFRSPGKAPRLRYCETKQLLLKWTRALHEELKGSGVTVNVVHPGVVLTPLTFKCFSWYNFWSSLWLVTCGRSPKSGAQTLIHLSVESIAPEDNGHYWAECRRKATSRGNDPHDNARAVDITRRELKIKRS
ncbi:retinol dehydrogenase 12-like [Galendromus occidentalis]|uniref:Retinol dehydrogenase 12-like n=1 Tax=Galendromus occidentalis TaxID=34638 RepID=A0AAJ6QYH9_9ACAR|nr:retinol dehydrogenase 12-like [Galendromus occidentalis]